MQGQSKIRIQDPLYLASITLLLGLCGSLVYWTVRLAYGNVLFRSQSVTALQRAARLDPLNASYFAELALRAEPAIADSALERATELDPLNSNYWIQRGVRAEFAGDLTAAEQYFLRASQVSRLLGPRISLANFYLRRGNPDQFWKWARSALDISYGDLEGTFLLCWQMTPDAKVILDRALPQRPGVLAQFLKFVVQQAGAVAAQPVAEVLLTCADEDSRDALLDYCERLIAAGRFPAAHEIWLGLDRRGLLGSGVHASGNLLYNAAFDARPLQRAFDWKVTSNSDVTSSVQPGGIIEVTLTGEQPEQFIVLSQVVALDGSGSCRFSFESLTKVHSDPGLTWRVEDLETHGELARLPVAGSDQWTPQVMQLTNPHTRFILVTLEYERRSGTIRYEGRADFRRLRLEANR